MNYIEPFKYPLRNVKRLVLGGLMVFPGVILLFIPYVMSSGYLIRVGERTLKGENELPEFSGYKNLFIKGLGYILIGIPYGIIIAFIFLSILFFITVSTTLGEDVSLVLTLILYFVGFVSIVIVSLLCCIAGIKYGEGGSVEYGFKFIEIWRDFRKSATKYFAGYVLLLFVLGLFVATCIIFLHHITSFIYFLILSFGIIYFYFCLVFERMFAQIYKESKEESERLKNLRCQRLLKR